MKKLLLILLTVTLMSCVSQGKHTKIEIDLLMGETEITLPGGAKGTLVIASEEPSPFVVMYHGYGSVKDEVGNMYKDEADRLQEMGISSLRIGYRGWDDPKYGQDFITVDTMMEDAQEALDYVHSLPYADSNRVGLLGFSMGGGVAQYISGMNPMDIAGVVTWSSSIEFESLVSEDDKAVARKDGIVTIDLGWRTITHSKAFVDSLGKYTLLETFSAYTNPLLVIDGTDDFLYPNTAVLKQLRPDAEIYEIEGADHIYHVFTGNGMAQDVITKTAAWFGLTL